MVDIRSMYRKLYRSKWFWYCLIPLLIMLGSVYLTNKDQAPKPTMAVSENKDDTKITAQKPEPTPSKIEKKASEEIIRVDPDRTGKLFGDVRVSVKGISFEGEPLGHKVTAKVEGFNQVCFFEKAAVGDMVTLEDGNLVYEVRVHEVRTFTAEFSGVVREKKK